jgi:hypothetical protein
MSFINYVIEKKYNLLKASLSIVLVIIGGFLANEWIYKNILSQQRLYCSEALSAYAPLLNQFQEPPGPGVSILIAIITIFIIISIIIDI